MHYQRISWIQTLHHPRWWKEEATVLGVGLHHHLSKQRSLWQTRRRCYPMLDFRLLQQDGQQAQDLRNSRWFGVLFTRKMLDSCTQERWKLPEAHQEIVFNRYMPPTSYFNYGRVTVISVGTRPCFRLTCRCSANPQEYIKNIHSNMIIL